MGIRETFRRWLGRPDPEPEQDAALREAAGVTIDDDEDQWRRLSGDAERDLSPLSQARMRDTALYLWDANLLANRIVELPLAYILAEGVGLVAADESMQPHLDRFWADPINQMDLKLPKKLRELSIYGEQCWPTFVNEHDGHVRLGYLDPALISTVVTDPDNPEQPIGIVTTKDRKGTARRYRVIVNGPESVFTERTISMKESVILNAGFIASDSRATRNLRLTAWLFSPISSFAIACVSTFCFTILQSGSAARAPIVRRFSI